MSVTTKFYDNYIKDNTEISLKEVAESFDSAANYPSNLKKLPNHQERFIDWLKGLPSGLNFALYNGEILELGKKSGYLTDKEDAKKEATVIKNYYPSLSMAFIRAFKKNGINWY